VIKYIFKKNVFLIVDDEHSKSQSDRGFKLTADIESFGRIIELAYKYFKRNNWPKKKFVLEYS